MAGRSAVLATKDSLNIVSVWVEYERSVVDGALIVLHAQQDRKWLFRRRPSQRRAKRLLPRGSERRTRCAAVLNVDGTDLKQNSATKHIPIVAITAAGETFGKEVAHAAGCDAYIVKPLDTRTLNEQIMGAAAHKSEPSIE